MKNFMNEQRGITLIALVITIIVMLVLAGVGIAMITGEGGLMGQASDAREQSDKASIQEKIELAYMAAMTNKEGKLDKGIFKTELNKLGAGIEAEITFPLTVTIEGQQFTISENGEVTK